MDMTLLILSCLSYGYVCILPWIFFKGDGRFNLMWLLTAWPFAVYPALLIANQLGYVGGTWAVDAQTATVMQGVGALLHVLAVSLISLTIGTHRIPLALWHQENDAPKSIITFGAYAKFRHPFYTSFILGLTAGILVLPHPITVAIGLYGFTLLTLTAKKEEGKLSQSEFGEEYQAYMKNTGRFFPKFF